jgi:hypothetical protein
MLGAGKWNYLLSSKTRRNFEDRGVFLSVKVVYRCKDALQALLDSEKSAGRIAQLH